MLVMGDVMVYRDVGFHQPPSKQGLSAGVVENYILILLDLSGAIPSRLHFVSNHSPSTNIYRMGKVSRLSGFILGETVPGERFSASSLAHSTADYSFSLPSEKNKSDQGPPRQT